MISSAHCYKLVLSKEQSFKILKIVLVYLFTELFFPQEIYIVYNGHNHPALLNLNIKFLVSNQIPRPFIECSLGRVTSPETILDQRNGDVFNLWSLLKIMDLNPGFHSDTLRNQQQSWGSKPTTQCAITRCPSHVTSGSGS